MGASVCLLFLAILLLRSGGKAQSGPQLPCGQEPVPAYPALDNPAVVKSWSKAELGLEWTPPACTGWASPGFTTLVTTTCTISSYVRTLTDYVFHIGAISELRGLRYWSTTHKQWRTLVLDAYALTGLRNSQRREDFKPVELREGSLLYFEQIDNLSGGALYQMRIVEASADRLVINIENASTMRYLFIPLFHPGEVQSVYFLDRESENVWRYYGISRTGKDSNQLIKGNESSAANRRCVLSPPRRDSH